MSGGGGFVAAYLGGSEDVLDCNGNLGADTVTLDQADGIVALFTCVSYAVLVWEAQTLELYFE